MNDLQQHENVNLPTRFEDLQSFILLNTEKLKVIRQQIKLMDRLSMAKEVLTQKKEEMKKISILVIEAEIKVNELVNEACQDRGTKYTDFGITKKQKYRFYKLTEYKCDIPQLVDRLMNKNNIPSPSNVFELIKKDRESSALKRPYKKIRVRTDYHKRIYKWMLDTLEKYLSQAKGEKLRELLLTAIAAIREILGMLDK